MAYHLFVSDVRGIESGGWSCQWNFFPANLLHIVADEGNFFQKENKILLSNDLSGMDLSPAHEICYLNYSHRLQKFLIVTLTIKLIHLLCVVTPQSLTHSRTYS
jgi:hypothetical protein